jgi:hypothetical protein
MKKRGSKKLELSDAEMKGRQDRAKVPRYFSRGGFVLVEQVRQFAKRMSRVRERIESINERLVDILEAAEDAYDVSAKNVRRSHDCAPSKYNNGKAKPKPGRLAE